MNTASLELCKELYELSGWESDYTWGGWESDYTWASNGSGLEFIVKSNDGELGHDIYRLSYAYDLGYLLRKLPDEIQGGEPNYESTGYLGVWKHKTTYTVGYIDMDNTFLYIWGKDETDDNVIEVEAEGTADTPEDAACKLTIELFKQGVLK